MARIFVAHQEQGPQSPLAGLADAVKEQRLMAEEQRRYEQQTEQEARKLELAGEQMRYERQRNLIEDTFRSRELDLKAKSVEAEQALAERKLTMQEKESGAKIQYYGAQTAEAEAEALDEAAMLSTMRETSALQVQGHFKRIGSLPIDQSADEATIQERKRLYDAALTELANARRPDQARDIQKRITALMAEDELTLKTAAEQRTLSSLTQTRSMLLDELSDPERAAMYGFTPGFIDGLVTETNDPTQLAKEVDKLRDARNLGMQHAALQSEMLQLESGAMKGPEGEALKEVWSQRRTWLKESETREKLLEDWDSHTTSLETKIQAGKKMIALARMRADPRLQTANQSMVDLENELTANRQRLANSEELMSRVNQSFMPPADRIPLSLMIVANEKSGAVSDNAKQLATALMSGITNDQSMARGEVRPTSLLQLLAQAQESGAPVDDDTVREVFTLMTRLGPGADLESKYDEFAAKLSKAEAAKAEARRTTTPGGAASWAMNPGWTTSGMTED